MSYLFSHLENFNADVSSWDTSGVTDMSYMFYVRSSRLAPSLESAALPVHATCAAAAPHAVTPSGPHPVLSTRHAGSDGVQPAAEL